MYHFIWLDGRVWEVCRAAEAYSLAGYVDLPSYVPYLSLEDEQRNEIKDVDYCGLHERMAQMKQDRNPDMTHLSSRPGAGASGNSYWKKHSKCEAAIR